MSATAPDQASILIVDDSPVELNVLSGALNDAYRVRVATTGAKALALATQAPCPDVILLDLWMDDMNGFQICEQLKSNPETRGAVIIFVSAQDTNEDKLKGYALGANDFLVKPVDPDILRKKVELAVQGRRAAAELLAEKQSATQTAMIAMSSAGDLHIVLDFMRQSFALMHHEAVARLLVDAVSQYSLESTLQVRATHATYHVCSHGTPSLLEIDMLNRMRERGRMVERNNCLIVNFPSCSLLVKNMPEEPLALGRLRDSLGLLMEGADARLKAMELEIRNNHLMRTMINMVNDSKQQLSAIHRLNIDRRELRETSRALIDKSKTRLIRSLQARALPEDQIQETMQSLEECLKYLQDNFELGLAADNEIMKLLDRLTENLQSVILA